MFDGVVPMSPGFAIHVFDLAKGKEKYVLRGHTSPISALTFSNDSTLLASANFHRSSYGSHGQGEPAPAKIKVWSIATGNELMTIQGHGGRVNCLAFDLEGNRLASASDDGTAESVADRPHGAAAATRRMAHIEGAAGVIAPSVVSAGSRRRPRDVTHALVHHVARSPTVPR